MLSCFSWNLSQDWMHRNNIHPDLNFHLRSKWYQPIVVYFWMLCQWGTETWKYQLTQQQCLFKWLKKYIGAAELLPWSTPCPTSSSVALLNESWDLPRPVIKWKCIECNKLIINWPVVCRKPIRLHVTTNRPAKTQSKAAVASKLDKMPGDNDCLDMSRNNTLLRMALLQVCPDRA